MSSDFSDKVIGNVYTKVENESLWDIRKSWAQLFYGLHTFEAGEALGLNVSRPAEGQPGGWGWSAAKISVDGWGLWSDKDVIEWWPRVDHDYIHSGAISYLCRDAQSSLVILPAYTTISKSQLARLSSSVSCVIVRDTCGNLFSSAGGTSGPGDPDGVKIVEAIPLPLLSALVSVIGVVQERSSLIPPYIFETLVVVVITFLLKPLVVASVYRIDGKTGVAGGSEWFRPWVPRAVDILAVSALGVVVADEEERWSPLVFKVLGGLMLLSGLVAGWGDESLRVRLWATFLRYPARIVKTLTISVVAVVALLILGVIGCINYFTPFTSIALYITQGCLFFADEEVNVVNNKAMGLIVTTLIATEQVITASCGGHSVPLWGHWLSVVRMVAIIPPVMVTVRGIVCSFCVSVSRGHLCAHPRAVNWYLERGK